MSGGVYGNVSTQTTSQDPTREAYSLGLLDLARARASTPTKIPQQKIAPLTSAQKYAYTLAKQGIGAYEPWMDQAEQYMGDAYSGFNDATGIANTAAGNANQYAQQFGGQATNTAYGAANQANGIAGMAPGMAYNPMVQAAQTGTAAGFAGAQGYNPYDAQNFMDPYQAMVTQRALGEMDRSAWGARQQNAASAVKQGAFGGSRHGLVESETERNLQDLKSNRIFEDYSRNYQQAQNAAMTAQEREMQRLQQAGQMAMQGGQAVSQSGIAALGLGANTALQGGDLAARTGLQAGELGAKTYLEGGRLGAGTELDAARGIAGLSSDSARLGGLEQLYGQQDAANMWNYGSKYQQYNQLRQDAAYNNSMAKTYDPYQRISWYSGIQNGIPSNTSSMTTTQTAQPSAASQLLGTGISVYNGINAYNKTGNTFGS